MTIEPTPVPIIRLRLMQDTAPAVMNVPDLRASDRSTLIYEGAAGPDAIHARDVSLYIDDHRGEQVRVTGVHGLDLTIDETNTRSTLLVYLSPKGDSNLDDERIAELADDDNPSWEVRINHPRSNEIITSLTGTVDTIEARPGRPIRIIGLP